MKMNRSPTNPRGSGGHENLYPEHIAGYTSSGSGLGYSYVGVNAHGEVVLKPNTNWPYSFIFLPGQARELARLLIRAAKTADQKAEKRMHDRKRGPTPRRER